MSSDQAQSGWSDEYSVGVDEIDDQHKKLTDLLSLVHVAVNEQQGIQAEHQTLGRLIEYTRTHFWMEESLMRLSKYPNFENHRQAHIKLLLLVSDLQKKLLANNLPISPDVLLFLKGWLTHHMLESDRSFGEYFQKTNLQQGFSDANSPSHSPAASDEKPWWKLW